VTEQIFKNQGSRNWVKCRKI